MTATAWIVSASLVGLFAAFAAGLAWAQQHARHLSAAPAARPRRRPF